MSAELVIWKIRVRFPAAKNFKKTNKHKYFIYYSAVKNYPRNRTFDDNVAQKVWFMLNEVKSLDATPIKLVALPWPKEEKKDMFRSQRPLMAEIWRNSLACNVGFPIRITTFMFFNYLLSPSNFTVIYKVSATPCTSNPSPKILVLFS